MSREALITAVRRVAWGYIFLHLNFSLGSINLLPDWAGYLLILTAIPILDKELGSSHLLRPLGYMLTTWAVWRWLLDCINEPHLFAIDLYGLETVVSVISLYFHFQLLTELAEIAKRYDCPQEHRILTLRTVRTILFTAALPFTTLFPRSDFTEWALIILLVIQVIVALWLMIVLMGLKNSLAESEEPSPSAE